MDSNFRVNITTDISELQAGLKRVQAELDKFKKSADGAALATKNMEANANRGRMTAFAFGQVIRDAGFFANSFSLGILAISNNIPILIDQLTLSVKALQPFAGYITIASSLLTAALTIWAYSAQAVEKNTDSLEEYVKTLDATNRAQLKGIENSSSELTTLKLLYGQTQNATLSLKARKSAVDQLQELYPKYFANLSDEAILAGKGAKNYAELTNSIIASAKARGGADIIAENTKEEYLLQKRIADAKAAQAELDSQKAIQQQIYNAGSLEESNAAAKQLQSRKLNNILNAAAIADIGRIGAMQLRLNQLKGDDLKIQDLINKEIEKGGSLTEDFGKDIEGPNSYQKALEKLSESIKKINENTSLTFNERNKALVDAYKSAIDSLASINTPQASEKILELRDAIFQLNKEIYKSEGNKFALDLFNKKSQQDAKDSIADLENLNDVIQQGLNTDKFFNDSEALKEYMTMMGQEMASILNNGIVAAVGNSMMAIGEAFATGGNAAKAFGAGILSSLSSILSQLADKLIAAGIAGITFSTAMKNLFDTKNWGIALAAGIALKVAAGAAGGFARGLSGGGGSGFGGGQSSPTPSFGGLNTLFANTSMTNSAAMTTASQPVLETRVSGNDLVILMNRSSNARNNYY